MSILGGIASVAGAFGSLFGKKDEAPTPAQNILSQAQGAREAAEKYGFNPLTLLGASSGISGLNDGPAPLASTQLILDGLQSIEDERTGKKAQERQKDQLELDPYTLLVTRAPRGPKCAYLQVMSGLNGNGNGRKRLYPAGAAGGAAKIGSTITLAGLSRKLQRPLRSVL